MNAPALRYPLLRPWALGAIALIGLIYVWFLNVISHRIGGAPYVGFAGVFVTGCGDFEHFYLAAHALRDGVELYLAGVGGYIYPPLIALLFTPLTLVSVQTAAWIMLVVNLSLGLVCAWVASAEAMRRLDIRATHDRVVVVMALATLLSATRLRSEFQMWQTNILILTALVFALRALDRRPRLAGLLLGLAFNIKYLPIVFLPYLLMRRRFVAAGWFGVGIIGFALAPALVSGWSANLRNWGVALGGLGHLLGLSHAAHAAHVDPITVGHSLSITSGLARMLVPGGGSLPVGAVALAALVTAAVIAAVYRQAHQPLFAWPGESAQASQPWRGLIAFEWAALIALVLAFSPQTNPRHTSLLLLAFVPLSALLCFPRSGGTRWPALAAAAILFFGLTFPPNTPEFARQLTWWREVSGAGWCMLLMLPFLLRAGLVHASALSLASAPEADTAALV